ncbi:MAG: 2,3-bisphosphoglycerate-independent phosphoglycerate mutase [Desulfuromonadaceae bacterium]|nr:2,3-bisphosphoglycerate-independent phosphoglycerate mutase [Desulfuromonadaceae bacterium]
MSSALSTPSRPVVLCILDGWGISSRREGNAVLLAQTPFLDHLFANYPHSQLQASGLAVGLPEGQMGNSEVGHMNIGAGRVIYQDLTRITKSIEDGDFFTNPVLLDCLARTRAQGGKLHLMGLLSDGGVHSLNTHLYALVQLAKQQQVEDICIHAFLDGRDTPPQSAIHYLKELEEQLSAIGSGRIATLCGRFYAMDRDQRWDRVEKTYQALTLGEGHRFATSAEAIETAYTNAQTDEFVEPCVISDKNNRIEDGDGVIFFNFRADRAREISRALTQPDFSGFERPAAPKLAGYVCLTEYDESLALPVAYPPESYPNILSEVVARGGMTQLHIAETEKYAHVTFFFNGGSEEPYQGEERVLIPSPKDVATYDKKPQMSATLVADAVIEHIQNRHPDLVILNFANPDMVGHTGVLNAAITAMETVDQCARRVVECVLERGGCLLITADHGNCEQMLDESGNPHTAHTTNPVPLIYVANNVESQTLDSGILADIAPTLLRLLNLAQPDEMTGHNLLHRRD